MQASVLDHYINGAFVSSEETFLKRSPVTGAVALLCNEAGGREIDAAMAAARSAYRKMWGQSTPAARSFALHRIANVMQARYDDLVAALIVDTGCSVEQAKALDVSRGISHLRYYADLITTQHEDAAFTRTQDGDGAQSFTQRQPLGVVVVLGASTLPIMWITAKIAPALAAGNCVVLKPSEHVPACANVLAMIIHESGLPAGVFNLVHGLGTGATGEALAGHEDVNAVSLVGARRTARALSQGERLHKHVRLLSEIGGKNAAIVMNDADFGKALSGVFKAAFINAGQTCVSVSEVFVHRSLYEKFVLSLRAAAGRIQLAPMISAKHREAVSAIVQLANDDGATLMAGGSAPRYGDARDNGSFFLPTILTGLHDGAPARNEDVFGPLCHISMFDEDEEVLRRVNRQTWVSCTIWSDSLTRVHRLAPQIRAATVWVNAWMLRDLRVPFVGGTHERPARDGGRWAIDNFSAITNVSIKV